MQAKMAVQVDHSGVAGAGPRDRYVRPLLVVLRIAVGHDDIESVDRAAHEDDDQALVITIAGQCPRRPCVGSEEHYASR